MCLAGGPYWPEVAANCFLGNATDSTPAAAEAGELQEDEDRLRGAVQLGSWGQGEKEANVRRQRQSVFTVQTALHCLDSSMYAHMGQFLQGLSRTRARAV